MLRRRGKIKKEYEHLANKVTKDLKDLVCYLIYDQKLDPEEVIGTVTSATVLLVSQENTKKRMRNSKEDSGLQFRSGREAFKKSHKSNPEG